MSRPTEINRYPPQFLELANRFEENPTEVIRIPVMEGMKPKALSMDLQNFRIALLRQQKDDEPQKYPNFATAEIAIGLDKCSVVISRKDRTPSAIAVGRALAGIKGSS